MYFLKKHQRKAEERKLTSSGFTLHAVHVRAIEFPGSNSGDVQTADSFTNGSMPGSPEVYTLFDNWEVEEETDRAESYGEPPNDI